MDQQKRERLGHGGDYRSGLQPSSVIRLVPGATPQAGMERAFGALVTTATRDVEPIRGIA
jgi:hypothetical protein